MVETIQIKGMSCGGCVNSVKRALGRLPLQGVSVEVGRARVEYDMAQVEHAQIVKAIEVAGFEVVAADVPGVGG